MASFIAFHPPRSNDLSRRSVLQGAVACGALAYAEAPKPRLPPPQQPTKTAQ
jgi:hypothetical protein